jgi:sugar/nucleoside kinase (ribokinase family)
MDINLVIAGRLHRDTLLPAIGRPLIDVPGGNLLYAATGAAVWGVSVGLLARVGEDYPQEWLEQFKEHGLDPRGVQILPEALDLRFFQASLDLQTVQHTNPLSHFARLGLPFPKSLLGYQPPLDADDDRMAASPASPRPEDIPPEYLEVHSVHLCPLDFLTHTRLHSAFRQAGVTTLTLDPSPGYFTGPAREKVRSLVHGLTAFLPDEQELRRFFWGQSSDLWEMAEEVASFGCELVVVKRGAHGQMLFDARARKRYEIPAYPARTVDPTGAGDSFCGGFLAGYQSSYDPLQAVLLGNISASLAIEGSGAFHVLSALPGLAQARLDSLRRVVQRV